MTSQNEGERRPSVRRPLVLVTGATGRVGTGLRPYLREAFDLRLFDRVPSPDVGPGESMVVGDLTDYATVLGAVQDVDAVLHLACVHGLGLRFADSVPANFTGTMTLLEAMRASRITRHVYASSHHVLGAHPSTGLSPAEAADLDLAPDAVYGLGKAFGEIASSMYARRYGIKTMLIRIGNADPQVGDGRSLRMWISARDLSRLVSIGLTDDRVECDIVYGVSRSPQPMFANARALELGYEPLDDAAANLAPDFVPYADMGPEKGRDFIGGAYAALDMPAPEPEETS
ncbi:MAG TPA: NAD(P)-dependent oxidoreductase [Trueperaceae bacterium]|nr:NAD(P)-dependent oxidoreductase [Trueperaceae bacterium]